MTGIIVTGHGSYATGITSGLKLLAGEPEHYRAVDFLPEDSTESLEEKLRDAIKQLAECDKLLILADLVGGSPFNVSLRLKLSGEWNMEVIGGCNLPVVLESYMSRIMEDDVEKLASSSAQVGREQLVHYVQQQSDDDDDYEE